MSTGDVEDLPLSQIYSGPKVREERLDLDHVKLLCGVDSLTPITVRRTAKGLECLDGAHRCAARRSDGETTVRGVVVELDDAEALEFAYSANNDHGLALTMSERKAGARKFIETTQLSDATIAKIVGLHRDTVAKMRPVQPAENRLVGRRQGADGKDRPDSKEAVAAQRQAIAAMLAEHPDLSGNEIARRIGCSAMTVVSVRNELAGKNEQPEVPAPPAAHPTGPVAAASTADGGQSDDAGGAGHHAPQALGVVPPLADGPPAVGELIDHCPPAGTWVKHPAMAASNTARATAQYFDKRLPRTDDSPKAIAANVPAPLRSQAAFAARLAAEFWTAIADDLANPTHLTSVEEA